MTSASIDRQRLSSNNPEELNRRTDDVEYLLTGIVGRHIDFFEEPQNRLDFLASMAPESFSSLAQFVNARLRGEKPSVLRKDKTERGGSLPMLHTPSVDDKPAALHEGFREIQRYLQESEDTVAQKVEGAAMAVEALVIWVHPFNDGNGRTSRFLGRMIEQGVGDPEDLTAQTISSAARPMIYRIKRADKSSLLSDANNPNIMLDDAERDELRARALDAPSSIDAIALSVRDLLENDSVREDTRARYTKITTRKERKNSLPPTTPSQ